MNALAAEAQLAVATACFSALALRSSREYGLDYSPVGTASAVAALLATDIAAVLGARGAVGWATSILIACSAVSAATDVQNGHIFDRVLRCAAVLLAVLAVASGRLSQAMLGAALGGGLLLLPWLCSRGRGMGLGDVKFAAVLGLGLGASGALRAIWFAFACGGALAAALLLTGRASKATPLPLGPFLALGAGFALVS